MRTFWRREDIALKSFAFGKVQERMCCEEEKGGERGGFVYPVS
jgi:hypothetical protein